MEVPPTHIAGINCINYIRIKYNHTNQIIQII